MKESRHRVPILNTETSWTTEAGLKAQHSYFRGALTLFYSQVKRFGWGVGS